MDNRIIIDLGCGTNKYKGAIGVDNVKLETVDIVHDLLCFPYPFERESADKIILSHVLEHFALEDIIKVLNECGRILKGRGGKIIISVPHIFSPSAFSDPGHKSHFTYESLYYFTKGFCADYRKDLKPEHNWKIEKIWTSVNVFNDHFHQPGKCKRILSDLFSKIFNVILRRSNSMTLPDIIAKLSPFWLINIHAKFCKRGEEG